VTALCADVERSMDLSGTLDPDDWWSLMADLFEVLSEGVDRFGGRVERFTGDGMLAVFGAPTRQADHAWRACSAALWLKAAVTERAQTLRRKRGLCVAMRMGINSGEAVIGTIGAPERPLYAIMGHSLARAQRMETLAMPGSVYVTGYTAALVRSGFDFVDRGAFEVKGEREPVPVHELVGVL
jgi:class 3 adenylate cyclase